MAQSSFLNISHSEFQPGWKSYRNTTPAYRLAVKPYHQSGNGARERAVTEDAAQSAESRGSLKYNRINHLRHGIRLVQLLPPAASDRNTASGGGGSMIRCILEHASLDDRPVPKYVGLSYAWGDPHRTSPIIVNDSIFHASENLVSALRHLQHRNETLVLWIDAICINQADDMEKSSQVKMMGQIYEMAVTVLAWLGPEADESDLAMRKLDELHRHPSRGRESEIGDEWVSLTSVGESEDVDIPIATFMRLFARPWWRRLWVLQEVTLSEEVIFVCGSADIKARDLEESYGIYTSKMQRVVDGTRGPRDEVDPSYCEYLDYWDFRVSITSIQSKARGRKRRTPLLQLLYMTFMVRLTNDAYQVSDHRDLVFALLSMAEDLSIYGIYADYSKTPDQVFVSLAVSLLNVHGLGMLSVVQSAYPGSDNNLPSWVPDWSHGTVFPIQNPYTKNSFFSASGPAEAKYSINFDETSGGITMSISAITFDTIRDIGVCYDESGCLNVYGTHNHFLSQFPALLDGHPGSSPYESSGDREEALWQTPIADLDIIDSKYHRASSNQSSPLPRLRESWRALQGLSLPPQHCADPDAWIRDSAKFYLETMQHVSTARRAFITEKGYLGLGPWKLNAGDSVVIFLGATVPFVLRKAADEKWSLLGEAYVHGIMDGEFMNTNRSEAEMIILE